MDDNDAAVTAFVEICSRLDRLIAAQELTNSVILRLTATVAQHLDSVPADDHAAVYPTGSSYPVGRLSRGLGSLIPRP
jgi:hypothetical protein